MKRGFYCSVTGLFKRDCKCTKCKREAQIGAKLAGTKPGPKQTALLRELFHGFLSDRVKV